MKMNVFRMLLVCFFQELLLSSSLRPISSRVEAGNAARKRRRGEVTAVVGARMKNGTTRELAGFRMPNGLCLVGGVGLPKRVKFCAAFTTHKYWSCPCPCHYVLLQPPVQGDPRSAGKELVTT